MEKLSSKMLRASLGHAQLLKQVEGAKVMAALDQLFIEQWGKRVKHSLKTMSLENGTARVASVSSVLAGEIRIYEHQLILKINRRFGPDTLKKILVEI